MRLEALKYCETTLDCSLQSPRRTGDKSILSGWEHLARGHRVGVSSLDSPLLQTHLCLAVRPHRCLAPTASGNKERLSRKGEGKGSRPQTHSHRPSLPLPQWLPREGAGPCGSRTRDQIPRNLLSSIATPEPSGSDKVKVHPSRPRGSGLFLFPPSILRPERAPIPSLALGVLSFPAAPDGNHSSKPD